MTPKLLRYSSKHGHDFNSESRGILFDLAREIIMRPTPVKICGSRQTVKKLAGEVLGLL
jgi:hypothetical protein